MLLQFMKAAKDVCTGDLLNVMALMTTIVKILRIVIIAALILWGTIDMGKAVIAGDEKKIKEAQKPFIKRLISAVIVFLIPYIISIVMGLVTSDKSYQNCWNDAWEEGFHEINASGTFDEEEK